MMHLRPVASICTPLYSPCVQQPSQAARVRGATALRRVPGLGTSGPIFLMHFMTTNTFVSCLSPVSRLEWEWERRRARLPETRTTAPCA